MRPLSSSLPTRATHGRCVLCHLCRELWRGCAQVCTVRFRLCTVCTCVQNVLSPDGGFQRVFAKCAHICRMCRTLSQNSTRLGNKSTDRRSVRVSGKNSSGKDFSLGSKSEPWRRIRELFRPEGKVATFPGAPGAVRGRIWRFGQIWRPGGYSN